MSSVTDWRDYKGDVYFNPTQSAVGFGLYGYHKNRYRGPGVQLRVRDGWGDSAHLEMTIDHVRQLRDMCDEIITLYEKDYEY